MLAKKSDNKLATTTITNQLIDEIGRIRQPIKSGEGRPYFAGRIALAKVTTGVSGQSGRFNGRLQESEMKSDASGALVEADLGTFASTDNCEVWDASELAPELVFLIGQKTDGKLVFLRLAPDSIDVWVTQTGGSAGNQTTQCSFTYSIYPWSDPTKAGTPIATGVSMQGNGQRIANSTMTAGTIGRARQVSGTWKLLWVDEKFQQTNCT